MKLHIRALDGSSSRIATKVAFVTSDEVAAVVQCQRADGGEVLIQRSGREGKPIADVDHVAEEIGQVLHLYRDHSLVVYTTPGHTMRGDEENTADIYPPQQHPRISIGR